MKKAVLAIDQGTTGTTVLIVENSGEIRCRAYSEFRQFYPKPGWIEHDAEEIWSVTKKLIIQAVKKAKLKPHDIAAIGITNQRETTLLWDKLTGKPIYPAIVWQDTRTEQICKQLKEEEHRNDWGCSTQAEQLLYGHSHFRYGKNHKQVRLRSDNKPVAGIGKAGDLMCINSFPQQGRRTFDLTCI